MTLRQLLDEMYLRRLRVQIATRPVPRHVGIVMDGNRRWARSRGLPNPSMGHERGAEHIMEVLEWCRAAGIGHVTVFVASTDNLGKRSPREIEALLGIVERTVVPRLHEADCPWQVRLSGRLDLLPASTAAALKRLAEDTRLRDTGTVLTLAVGYGGRQEIVDALRAYLDEQAVLGHDLHDAAEHLTTVELAAHLYAPGQPDPELVIRTSGEQRMSGFLLWQSAFADFYLCDAYWPAFRELDFLRALRSFQLRARHRR